MIRQLRQRLEGASPAKAPSSPAAAPPPTTAPQPQPQPQPATPPALPPQAQLRYDASAAVSNAQPTLGQGNLYNPAITVFGDLGASLSTNSDNDAFNRFNLREFELDARAAIAPFVDGVFILSFGEEIDSTDQGTDVSTNTDLEEAYLSFHSLPFDLTAKVGKFRNAFGVNNVLHTHDLPQVTRPLATQAFLGPEGLGTVGVSVSWLVPNPWDQFIELTGEIVNADGGEESPILGGPDAVNPAYLAHLKWFTDVGDYGSLELGGSYLYARTAPNTNFDANVFGVDATLKLPDENAPDLRSFLWQTELYFADNDVLESDGGFRNSSVGAYTFAQYQFDKNWYAGVRFDYTEFPNDEFRGPGDRDWAVSPYLTWYLTEFLRLRFEYQHREFETAAGWDDENNFLLQFTFVIGAHPPHPYWVNR